MKYQAGLLAITSFLVGASTLYADSNKGSIVMIGKGTASSPPEFVSFSVKVTSICYNTSQEAQAENAKLASSVLVILEDFKKGERDKITASGGANIRQTGTTQIGAESKVLCDLKWRSENHLNISMSRMEDLPALQDKLFVALDQSADLNPAQIAQTFAEVSRPDFGLYPETSVTLRNEAEGLAFDDAKSQMKGLQARCPFQDPRLVSVAPPEYNYSAKSIMRSAGAYSGPVIPDEMEVSAVLRMEWEYTPSAACKQSL